ncbi:hypothetical protein [Algoriphagus halophilus]|uniref:Uncharacterized protein n=1 Tax=Algoriphagus halophilus TaxID=226505 RepID=A0A1N6FSU1_9BACT|nr:hypothetical protein [Algoriphagus halophilus]SIN98396.1 hypothetical protein SAMN05444394_2702 [Algoriphagus halophilus]
MRLFKQIFRPLRRIVWALIVAFMVGVHNFYKQEMDSPDTIISQIEIDAEEEDSSPKD